jgi:hypothetical protein
MDTPTSPGHSFARSCCPERTLIDSCAPAGSGDHDLAALACQVAEVCRHSAALAQRFFRICEERGIHVTPVHFYQPIPDTRTLLDHLWECDSALVGLDMNDAAQLQLLTQAFPHFRREYEQLPLHPTDKPHEFHLTNDFFGGTDALAAYCMVRHFQPRLILEVGSGFSSRLFAQAALRNGRTQVVCIEPYPDPVLQAGFPGLTALIPHRVQDVERETFQQLGPGDILFVDSSHVVSCGGDVNCILLEIVPRLKRGVIIHLHDIFLPAEYPRSWVKQDLRFWTEQYLLQAFLAFNPEFEVLLANQYLNRKFPDQMRATFSTSPWHGGGSFWIRRRFGPQIA